MGHIRFFPVTDLTCLVLHGCGHLGKGRALFPVKVRAVRGSNALYLKLQIYSYEAVDT